MNHSDQDTPLPRPSGANRFEWREYWGSFGQRYRINDELWRTEPEIPGERQQFLQMRRSRPSHIRESKFAFKDKDIHLNRADVEWLLATHESANAEGVVFTGPINWKDQRHLSRPGLDLRGADLTGEDLSHLPLSRMIGGLTLTGWRSANETQRDGAAVNFERANLNETKLESAELWGANLKGAKLERARLDSASLGEAILEGADMRSCHLEGAVLRWASLDDTYLRESHLEGADLREASLLNSQLDYAFLEGADLRQARLDGTLMTHVHFGGKRVTPNALERIRRWQPTFPAQLPPADLRQATFDTSSKLDFATLGDARGSVLVADTHWGGMDLGQLDWESVAVLGDESRARERFVEPKAVGLTTFAKQAPWRFRKPANIRLDDYQAAVRAYRQLATALGAQGINEEAARYAFHAQRMQRVVYRRQIWLKRVGHRRRTLRQRINNLVAYLFAVFMGVIAGYGYRPSRTLVWYFVVIGSFTFSYFALTHAMLPLTSPLHWYEALVLSVSAFHGRGFFEPVGEGDPVAILAAVEAVIGLMIEICFIASVTLRFFGKGSGN